MCVCVCVDFGFRINKDVRYCLILNLHMSYLSNKKNWE